MCQWLKKLSELRNDKLSEVTMRHEYLQYLRMTLQGDYQLLTKPFNTPPPDDELVPFAECIANKTADAIPDVPRAGECDIDLPLQSSFILFQKYQTSIIQGKLQPVLCHKSEDDRAFMCIKRTPDNGILCYMAVAPDSNAMQQGE